MRLDRIRCERTFNLGRPQRAAPTRGGKVSTQSQMENIIDVEEHYQVATYKKFPFVVERGEDVWGYTSAGERYLDLYGGHAVVSTGHSHPRGVRAISDQPS